MAGLQQTQDGAGERRAKKKKKGKKGKKKKGEAGAGAQDVLLMERLNLMSAARWAVAVDRTRTESGAAAAERKPLARVGTVASAGGATTKSALEIAIEVSQRELVGQRRQREEQRRQHEREMVEGARGPLLQEFPAHAQAEDDEAEYDEVLRAALRESADMALEASSGRGAAGGGAQKRGPAAGATDAVELGGDLVD